MRQITVDKGTTVLTLEDDEVLGQVYGKSLYPVFRAGTLHQVPRTVPGGVVNPAWAWRGEIVGCYETSARRQTVFHPADALPELGEYIGLAEEQDHVTLCTD